MSVVFSWFVNSRGRGEGGGKIGRERGEERGGGR